MDAQNLCRALMDFLDKSPNSFFTVKNISNTLLEAGFCRLGEGEAWELEAGHDYFTTRNGSSLIAFRLPHEKPLGFQLMASHTDSPTFRVKPNPVLSVEDSLLRLNTERYGGMILSTWLDRPLSVAGRVLLRTTEGIESRLINIDRDLLVIPSLAIHMDRTVNDGYAFNAQRDMLPLFSMAGSGKSFSALLAEAAGCAEDEILDGDLFLYNHMPAALLGAENEFIASGRLDDLQCVFASLNGFLNASPDASAAVYCVFDNEEVGSGTKQGGGALFLRDTLDRINTALGGTHEELLRRLANSFMASADNAHAVHPNHIEKADPSNRPRLNGGIVVKYCANQKYATDAVSAAIFKTIATRAGVPLQSFANRSDIAGGSTLGTILDKTVPVNTVDIGLPQLAMHSAWETAGVKDTFYLAETARALFSVSVRIEGEGRWSIR